MKKIETIVKEDKDKAQLLMTRAEKLKEQKILAK